MNLKIAGSIIASNPEVGGVSQKGTAWRSKEYVLQTAEKYPKKVAFSIFGERIDQYPLNIGDTVEIECEVSSREYKGRWFTSVTAWSVTHQQAAAPMPVPAPQPAMPSPPPAAQASLADRMSQMYGQPTRPQPAPPADFGDLPF